MNSKENYMDTEKTFNFRAKKRCDVGFEHMTKWFVKMFQEDIPLRESSSSSAYLFYIVIYARRCRDYNPAWDL